MASNVGGTVRPSDLAILRFGGLEIDHELELGAL